MKYRYIGMSVLFLVSYFGISFLVALFGLDPVLSTIISDIIISVLGVLYMRRLPDMLQGKPTWFHALYMLVLLFFLWLFSQITVTYFLTVHGDTNFDAYQASVAMNPTAFLFLSILIAPISEEILMRGVVYRSLKQIMPVGFAYVISAVAFAVMHGTLVHIIIGVVCGILFTFVYEYTGDIRYNIAMHVLYNSLSVILGGVLTLPNFLFQPIVFGIFDFILVGLISYEIIRLHCYVRNAVMLDRVNADANHAVSE